MSVRIRSECASWQELEVCSPDVAQAPQLPIVVLRFEAGALAQHPENKLQVLANLRTLTVSVRTSDLAVDYFALPNQAALIADDSITTVFVGSIFQQNIISLAVRRYVETDRPSRQDLRCLRKMHVPKLRRILCILFLPLVRRVEDLKGEMILATKGVADKKHIPTGKGAIFEFVSVFSRVDGAQRIHPHASPCVFIVGRLHGSALSPLSSCGNQNQTR